MGIVYKVVILSKNQVYKLMSSQQTSIKEQKKRPHLLEIFS